MANAKSLLSAITSPEFLAALIITNRISSYTTSITRSLQSQSRDIVEAISGIDVLCDTLQSVRDDVDTHHCRWMDETKKMCEDIGVELCIPRLCGRQKHRDNVPAGTPDEYYKRNLTIPLLDHVLMEMKSRFRSISKVRHKACVSSLLQWFLWSKQRYCKNLHLW